MAGGAIRNIQGERGAGTRADAPLTIFCRGGRYEMDSVRGGTKTTHDLRSAGPREKKGRRGPHGSRSCFYWSLCFTLEADRGVAIVRRDGRWASNALVYTRYDEYPSAATSIYMIIYSGVENNSRRQRLSAVVQRYS